MNQKIRPWAVVFWLAVWQIASMRLDQQLLLVSPLRVIARLAELSVTGTFWSAVGYSMARIVWGFSAGMITGVGFAVLSARFRLVEDLLSPVMLTIKSVPVASFIILALIWFSSKNLAVLISFLMVVPIVYSNILVGIRAADRKMLEMAQVFGISSGRRIRYIYMPQVFPYFHSACASALGLSWKAGIAAEVIGIPAGSIGAELQQAKVYLDTPDVFAWTLVIVLASLAFERLFGRILLWCERWTERM